MAASTCRSSQSVLRSLSPSSRLCSPRTPSFSSTPSAFASSPARTFSSASSPSSSASPSPSTPVNLRTPGPSAARFSLESSTQKRTCLCSPSTHPGAFRCKLHRKITSSSSSSHAQTKLTETVSTSDSRRIHLTKLAMMNSLASRRIVKGDLLKKALGNLVRPSSYQQCRSLNFRPGPSRLSVMSRAEDS